MDSALKNIPDGLKNLLKDKMANFKEFIISVVSKNKKDELSEQINDLQNDYLKILMFVIFINESKKKRILMNLWINLKFQKNINQKL